MIKGICRTTVFFVGLAFSNWAMAQVTMNWSPSTFKDSDTISISYSFRPSQEIKDATATLSLMLGDSSTGYIHAGFYYKDIDFPAGVWTPVPFPPLETLGLIASAHRLSQLSRFIPTLDFQIPGSK